LPSHLPEQVLLPAYLQQSGEATHLHVREAATSSHDVVCMLICGRLTLSTKRAAPVSPCSRVSSSSSVAALSTGRRSTQHYLSVCCTLQCHMNRLLRVKSLLGSSSSW
jgi:hypothetical protein